MDNLRNETLNGSGNQEENEEEKYDQEAIDQVVDIEKENSEISNINHSYESIEEEQNEISINTSNNQEEIQNENPVENEIS